MFAYFLRAMARIRQLRFVAAAIAVLATIPLGGCAGFFGAELNNRGGYLDAKLDDYWITADTKQMRVLRAYILIGSAIRMAETKSKTERKLIVAHANAAISVASDAYNCAYAPPGTCVYFDERMVEAEVTVLKLVIAVLSKKENEDLFEGLGKQLGDTFPILKSLDVLSKAVDAAAAAADTANTAAKLIQNLLKAGQLVYVHGRRLGALYRDSIELQMITVTTSLDTICSIQKNQFDEYTSPSTREWVPSYAQRFKTRGLTAEERWAAESFYGSQRELARFPTVCRDRDIAHGLWQRGAGDLSEWKKFLSGPAEQYRALIQPNENSFIQASDLIWRSCEHLTVDDDELSDCIGRIPPREKGETVLCAIDLDRYSSRTATELGKIGVNVADTEKRKNDLRTKYTEQCRLILHSEIVRLRVNRRSRADTRLDWLSQLAPSPFHPLDRRLSTGR